MAQIEHLIPHILQWECGVTVKAGESIQQAYERAKAKGVVTVKGDAGGATLCGVTLGTFREWRIKKGKLVPALNDLENLAFVEWLQILKFLFWDTCKADQIANQSVANMLVDWRWVNGGQAIRDAQFILGLVTDGIVGPKTVAALNSSPASSVFSRLKTARENAYRKIAKNRPAQQKFLNGWLNRTNAIKFQP